MPMVLLVEGQQHISSLVREAAAKAHAGFKGCGLCDAGAVAAAMRPLVIVIEESLYQFDHAAFDALAWDVGARIVRLSDEATADEVLPLVSATVCSVERVRRKVV